MRRSANRGIAGLALLLMACGPVRAPAPGHDRPIASREARVLLAGLEGRELVDEAGGLGGGRWTVWGFAVVPYRLPSGELTQGPRVALTRGDSRRYAPMHADGDVAELGYRVTGEWPAWVAREPSPAFRSLFPREPGSR